VSFFSHFHLIVRCSVHKTGFSSWKEARAYPLSNDERGISIASWHHVPNICYLWRRRLPVRNILALHSAVASWSLTAGTINWLTLPLARSQGGVARMTPSRWYLPINQGLLVRAVPRRANYDEFQRGFSCAARDVAMSLNVSDWLLQPPFPHHWRQVFVPLLRCPLVIPDARFEIVNDRRKNSPPGQSHQKTALSRLIPRARPS
jgi:hypothetical protein